MRKIMVQCSGEQFIWLATILLNALLLMGIFRYGIKFMLTPISAAGMGNVAAYIAYQQWQTNKLKIRLDLYERRFKIYALFSEKIDLIINSEKIAEGAVLEFEKATDEVRFLVKPEIETVVKKIIDLCSEIKRLQIIVENKYPGLPGAKGETQKEAAEKIAILLCGLKNERAALAERFLPYLDFQNID